MLYHFAGRDGQVADGLAGGYGSGKPDQDNLSYAFGHYQMHLYYYA